MGKEKKATRSMDDQYRDSSRYYQEEAMKNAINAFNEGYLLGMQHARKIFEGKDEN